MLRPSPVCEGMEITVGQYGEKRKIAPEPENFSHIDCDAWVWTGDRTRAPVKLGHNHWEWVGSVTVETCTLRTAQWLTR